MKEQNKLANKLSHFFQFCCSIYQKIFLEVENCIKVRLYGSKALLLCHLKMHGLDFCVCVKNNHSRGLNLKFQLNQSNCLDLRIKFVYCSNILLCKLKNGYQNKVLFPNIFQTRHIPAQNSTCLKKKYQLSLNSKIS